MRIIYFVCQRVCGNRSMNENCLDIGVLQGNPMLTCKCGGSAIFQKYLCILALTKATVSVQQSLNSLVQMKGVES